jgi:SM-20-related protein
MHNIMPTHQTQLARIIEDLSENGFAICEDFLAPETITALADEAQQRFISGNMQTAKTGKHAHSHQPEIRGDSILWLDENLANPSIQAYFSRMYSLKDALNEQLFMNVQELETHLAVYPVGAGYLKHLDQFQQADNSQNQARQLSSILYLNDDWQAADGGELRLYLSEQKWLDILPTAGKLVLFLSAKFWHEVLPAKRDRISLTGWFRSRSELF